MPCRVRAAAPSFELDNNVRAREKRPAHVSPPQSATPPLPCNSAAAAAAAEGCPARVPGMHALAWARGRLILAASMSVQAVAVRRRRGPLVQLLQLSQRPGQRPWPRGPLADPPPLARPRLRSCLVPRSLSHVAGLTRLRLVCWPGVGGWSRGCMCRVRVEASSAVQPASPGCACPTMAVCPCWYDAPSRRRACARRRMPPAAPVVALGACTSLTAAGSRPLQHTRRPPRRTPCSVMPRLGQRSSRHCRPAARASPASASWWPVASMRRGKNTSHAPPPPPRRFPGRVASMAGSLLRGERPGSCRRCPRRSRGNCSSRCSARTAPGRVFPARRHFATRAAIKICGQDPTRN